MATRTWKELVIKGVLAMAVFAVANIVVYYSSGFFREERNYHAGVDGFWLRPQAATVFVGDSHVGKIANEYLSDEAYNIAFGGDSYRECYAKLRYLLDSGAKIRTLVLTSDYHMFGSGRLQSSNKTFVDRYFLQVGYGPGMEEGWVDTAFNLVPLFNDAFVQYLRTDVRSMLNRKRSVSKMKAPSWQDLPESSRFEVAHRTGVSDHAGVGDQNQPFFWYERILDLAHEHDVQVIAVRYPAHPAYLAGTPAEGAGKVNSELMHFGINDVIELGTALPDATYFEDEDHVNEKGAALVLERLEAKTGLRLGRTAVGASSGE